MQDAFFEANCAEKLAGAVVDHSLPSSVGSEVKTSEETICIISMVKRGIDECTRKLL